MPEMTSWERVYAALHHQEPDRVPTALGGGPYGVVDALYFKLLRAFELGEPVAPFRSGHNISYQDDRLLERLGTDLRYVYPGASPSSPYLPTGDPETFIDGFGQTWRRATPYFYAERGILAEATSIEQIETLARWPDPAEARWTEGVAERARRLRATTHCWITARMVSSHGPFQTACDLRGTENLLVDFFERPEFALRLIERVTDALVGLLGPYLRACGAEIDMIELPGDDYAGNQNLLFSPAIFRKFVRPSLQRLVDCIREVRPDLTIMFHSDGAIYKLLPELIDLGIDVVHPLEPLPAMDLAAIKAEFGGRLCFLGGIDISHALPGSRQQVIDETRLRLRQLGAGGGYILAPANHIQADVPPENVITLFEAARRYGAYPLENA
jgi:uroporphyrinogen decarboxylase